MQKCDVRSHTTQDWQQMFVGFKISVMQIYRTATTIIIIIIILIIIKITIIIIIKIIAIAIVIISIRVLIMIIYRAKLCISFYDFKILRFYVFGGCITFKKTFVSLRFVFC